MNAVHPCHTPGSYARLHHYVFAFHDSTFECVAENLAVSEHDGPMTQLQSEMSRLLGGS